MKKLLLQKRDNSEVKCIDIFDASIVSQTKHIASILVDGEINFREPIYSQDIRQILTIQENFNLFYNNI